MVDTKCCNDEFNTPKALYRLENNIYDMLMNNKKRKRS